MSVECSARLSPTSNAASASCRSIIANGDQIKVPSNFVILATMNPFDRGVDEVDAAFERRFAKISMDPDKDLLDEILIDNGMDETLQVPGAWLVQPNQWSCPEEPSCVSWARLLLNGDG